MARDRQVVSKTMKRIKGKNTSIEVALRRALWKRGFRYRKNDSRLPGKPDIAISRHKIAIFCDSEFFHGKDWECLRAQLLRGSHPDYWIKKIERNRRRDRENEKQLLFLGWQVIRFWGGEILQDTENCVKMIEERIFEGKVPSDFS